MGQLGSGAKALTDIVVIDTETTGMSHDEDRVVEIAAVRLVFNGEKYDVDSVRHCVVDPERPIPAGASAVHHLTDADVVDARKLTEALEYIGVKPGDVIAAHNAEFDRGFLPALKDHDWVCTWKVSQKLLPESPSYGNQVLRYHLGIDVEADEGRGNFPHSAGYDARTTAKIMLRLLDLSSVEEMIRISSAPVLLPRMPFGKHRGMAFAEVPKDYLMWLKGRPDLDRDLRHTLEHHT